MLHPNVDCRSDGTSKTRSPNAIGIANVNCRSDGTSESGNSHLDGLERRHKRVENRVPSVLQVVHHLIQNDVRRVQDLVVQALLVKVNSLVVGAGAGEARQNVGPYKGDSVDIDDAQVRRDEGHVDDHCRRPQLPAHEHRGPEFLVDVLADLLGLKLHGVCTGEPGQPWRTTMRVNNAGAYMRNILEGSLGQKTMLFVGVNHPNTIHLLTKSVSSLSPTEWFLNVPSTAQSGQLAPTAGKPRMLQECNPGSSVGVSKCVRTSCIRDGGYKQAAMIQKVANSDHH